MASRRNEVDGLSVALLRPLAELLGRLDLDPRSFLAALEIDDASAPDAYVAGDRVDRLLEDIAAQRGDPAFGLTLARAAVVRPLGLFGHMVWLSGTVHDALDRAVKFYSVVTHRATLELEARGPITVLHQHRVPGVTRGPILTEFLFASFALRARAATGERFALRAVRFAHEREPTPEHADVFRAPLAFGAPSDELELETAQLALPLISADPITSAALEAQVATLTATGRTTFVDRVRRAAAVNLAAASLPAISQALGISARTLRRQLEHDGTTLRSLVDALRRERADHLLAAGVAAKEIAFELGFSEPSAFSRAYKRWTGRTPKV
ncbi:MAG: AraC family transcriptional regulator ligand-binding domain-containing protein [Deltaproteobacteria bacterium]